jgi:tetratricopeptide (TPR) repeat protein
VSDAEKSGSTLQQSLKEAIPILAPWLIFAGGLIFARTKSIPPLPKAWHGFLTAPQLTATVTGLLSFAGSLWQLWRNRRKHVQGKVQQGKVAIWVAELEGDGRQGAHRTNIAQTLKRELGASVQILRAGIELRADEAGDAADEASTANRKAQGYLSKHKGDLMIWGQVLPGPPVVIELRFTSPVHDGAGEKRYNYDQKLRLEEGFGKELGSALAAVAAQQALPAINRGSYVADVLIPVARKLAILANNLPPSMGPNERGMLLYFYALAESRIGEQCGDSKALNRAVRAYRASLRECTREDAPLDWARIQNSLGTALGELGSRESGTARLEEAVGAYRSALEEYTRERVPLDWAVTQSNLGAVLWTLGSRENGTARLEEAVEAHRAALEERTRERVPLDWAMTQSNLGATLRTLGSREGSTTRLEEAVEAYRAALEEGTRERVPLDWAMTQNNLGTALWELGSREGSTTRLEEAIAAYRAALEERTRERVPLQWAMTQNNLGLALCTLGSGESGTARLEEAVEAYRIALEEWTRERVPLNWAATQDNLGIALSELGEREGSTTRLEEAVEAYSAALEECTRERVPLDWARTQNNLGGALESLGKLPEAAEAYRRALEEFTPQAHPPHNGKVTRNLARVLAKLDGGAPKENP